MKNPLVMKMKQDLLENLYHHLEFVLLNNNTAYPLDKKVLE